MVQMIFLSPYFLVSSSTGMSFSTGEVSASSLLVSLTTSSLSLSEAENIKSIANTKLAQSLLHKQERKEWTNVQTMAESKIVAIKKKIEEDQLRAIEVERLKHEAALKAAEDEAKREQALAAAAEKERLKAEAEAARMKLEAEHVKKGAEHGILKDAFTRWKMRASSRKKIKKLSQELQRISGDIKSMFPQKSYGELLTILQSAAPEETDAASSSSFNLSSSAVSAADIDFSSLNDAKQRQLAARLALLECRAARDVRMYEGVDAEALIQRQMPWVINAVRTAQVAKEKRRDVAAQKMRRAKLKDHLSKKEEKVHQHITVLQEEHARERERLLAEIEMLRNYLATAVSVPPDLKDTVGKDPEFSWMQREFDKLKIKNARLRAQLASREKPVDTTAPALTSEPLFDPSLEAEWRSIMDGMKQREAQELQASVVEQQRLRLAVAELQEKNNALIKQHKLAEETRLRIEQQVETLTKEIAFLNEQVSTLEDQNKIDKDKISSLQKEEEKKGPLEKVLRTMTGNQRQLSAQLDDCLQENKKLLDRVSDLNVRNEESIRSLQEAKSKAKAAESLQARNTDLLEELRVTQDNNRKQLEELEQLRSDISLAEAKVQGFFERCREKDLANGRLQDQAAKQEVVIANLSSSLEKQKSYIATLQQQLSRFKIDDGDIDEKD